jgi:hypothetical protein
MTNKEKEIISKMIPELDGATGRLMVEAMGNPVVRKAMEMVSKVSFDLGNMLD